MKKITVYKTVRRHRILKLSATCKLLILAAALQPSGGCVKDDLHNTSHPDKGAVKVTADWSEASTDAALPESYVLRIGDKEQTVSGRFNAFNALFAPGSQDLLVYHRTDGITISGTTATVNTLEDGTLDPLPGYLFSAARKPDILKDDTVRVTVAMKQRIRKLVLVLNLKPGDEERIAGTSATLSGIAQAVGLMDGRVTSHAGKTTAPTFALKTGGEEARASGQPALAATLRLIGVMAEERQQLALTLTLTDGYVRTITTDLTERLKGFGAGSMEPLTLDTALDLPGEVGVSATVSDWKVVQNGDIDVH